MSIKKNSAGKKDDIPVFLKKVSIVQANSLFLMCRLLHKLCLLSLLDHGEWGVMAYRLVYIYPL